MKKTKILAIVILLLAIALSIFFFLGETSHDIIVNYEDGTDSPLSITYKNKRVVGLTYQVYGDPDISQYTPYFSGPFGHYNVTPGQKISIFRLLNYSLDDGDYQLSLIPEGTITKEGEEVLLEPITFTMTVYDDRVISIVVH